MFKSFSIKTRLIAVITFLAIILTVIGFIGLKGMNDSNAGLQSVYVDRAVPLAQLAEIMDLISDNVVQLHGAAQHDTRLEESKLHDHPALVHTNRIKENIAAVNKLWEEYTATYLTPEEKALADSFISKRTAFKDGLLAATAFYQQGRYTEGNAHMTRVVDPKFADLNKTMDSLKNLQVRVAKEEFDKASSNYASIRNSAVTVMIVAIGFAAFIGFMLIRGISRSLQAAQQIASAIATGDLGSTIDVRQQDEIGALLHSMKTMQDAINKFVTAQDKMAKKHAEGWISEKIDADKFSGIYRTMAQEINELVGTHIAVNMRVVDVISQYAKGDFSVDMDRLPNEKAKITAAIDSVKQSLLGISSEIKMIADSGAKGDFSKRGNAHQFQFMFREILTELNNLIDTCDQGFDDIGMMAVALAKGDLTTIISKDYPGTFGAVINGMNSTVSNLQELVGSIKDATDIINTAAKEIAAGNNDLSHRTEEQAASLEQTAASMEELTSTVQANTENAKQANQLVLNAADVAGKGLTVVGQVVATMGAINDSSRKIGSIISVIDGIAFQTNILALNAAVEAARAGEQGRGFAVVASEVRNLAQRATAAAGEIKTLIGDSEEKVDAGGKLVAKAGQTMKEIVGSINNVTAIMSEIAAASVEQSSGIAQVNQAIALMDDVTQQNAAMVEQAAAAAESLEEQTQNLSAKTGVFKVDGKAQHHYDIQKTSTLGSLATAGKIQSHQGSKIGKSQPLNVSKAITSEAVIDLDAALQKHSDWKVKLRTAISKQETLDAATIAKDNCCDFGKWLHGNGKHDFGHLANFNDCVAKHAKFHIEAGRVATAINEHQYAQADQMLAANSTFGTLSSEVGIAIMRLKKDVSTQKINPAAPSTTQPAGSPDWEEF